MISKRHFYRMVKKEKIRLLAGVERNNSCDALATANMNDEEENAQDHGHSEESNQQIPQHSLQTSVSNVVIRQKFSIRNKLRHWAMKHNGFHL